MVFGESWMYDLIIYMYALSVLFYFSDFLQPKRSINRLGFGFLTAVWLLMTAFLGIRMFDTGMVPVITLFETLFFYSWLLVMLSLFINFFFSVDLLVFFTNVVGFAIVAINFFSNRNVSDQLHEQLVSELLIIHITLSILSYAALSLAGVIAVQYIIQHRLLKKKQWNSIFRRLPSLEKLEKFTFRLTAVGVPLLLLGLILGAIWAYEKVDGNFWLDPKVIFSAVVVAVYGIYLYMSVSGRWKGKQAAYFNLAAFATIVVNYFISGASFSFHRWL